MSRNLILPFFSDPPAQYSKTYFAEVLRSFATYLVNAQNPGLARATNITLTNLPSTDFGLESGTLFQQGGFVKVALINAPHPGGVSATAGVGSVTVVTT
jgi:uncharacterized repeat protein (TIGR01451 family)